MSKNLHNPFNSKKIPDDPPVVKLISSVSEGFLFRTLGILVLIEINAINQVLGNLYSSGKQMPVIPPQPDKQWGEFLD